MENTETVHPMKKSYTLVSTKHLDLDNLSAFEATAMTLALVLAVSFGVFYQALAQVTS